MAEIVMPAASDSRRNAIEMRVPATRGLPPRCSGSATIHFIVPPPASRPILQAGRSGLNLQHFGARSGLELARVHGHGQHAVVANHAGELDQAVVAEAPPNRLRGGVVDAMLPDELLRTPRSRSEEHTSELQSRLH